jgi:hypothetical protein
MGLPGLVLRGLLTVDNQVIDLQGHSNPTHENLKQLRMRLSRGAPSESSFVLTAQRHEEKSYWTQDVPRTREATASLYLKGA